MLNLPTQSAALPDAGQARFVLVHLPEPEEDGDFPLSATFTRFDFDVSLLTGAFRPGLVFEAGGRCWTVVSRDGRFGCQDEAGNVYRPSRNGWQCASMATRNWTQEVLF